jgi:hypothetical protein
MTSLPNRPDPSKISFAADCFDVRGESVHWTVTRSALHSGPAKFTSETEAREFAARTGRTVTEVRSPRLVRVRWN